MRKQARLLKVYYRYKILEPYFQDDWHITKRLTLNLGLRSVCSEQIVTTPEPISILIPQCTTRPGGKAPGLPVMAAWFRGA